MMGPHAPSLHHAVTRFTGGPHNDVALPRVVPPCPSALRCRDGAFGAADRVGRARASRAIDLCPPDISPWVLLGHSHLSLFEICTLGLFFSIICPWPALSPHPSDIDVPSFCARFASIGSMDCCVGCVPLLCLFLSSFLSLAGLFAPKPIASAPFLPKISSFLPDVCDSQAVQVNFVVPQMTRDKRKSGKGTPSAVLERFSEIFLREACVLNLWFFFQCRQANSFEMVTNVSVQSIEIRVLSLLAPEKLSS